MISQALSHYQFPILSCIGMLIFLTIFIGSVLWTIRKNGSEFYKVMEALPLEDAAEPIQNPKGAFQK